MAGCRRSGVDTAYSTTLPRPYLARFIANVIDLLNMQEGDADLEPEVTEQGDEPEPDDHGGGNV